MSGSGAQQTRKPRAEETVEAEQNGTDGTRQGGLAATLPKCGPPFGAAHTGVDARGDVGEEAKETKLTMGAMRIARSMEGEFEGDDKPVKGDKHRFLNNQR